MNNLSCICCRSEWQPGDHRQWLTGRGFTHNLVQPFVARTWSTNLTFSCLLWVMVSSFMPPRCLAWISVSQRCKCVHDAHAVLRNVFRSNKLIAAIRILGRRTALKQTKVGIWATPLRLQLSMFGQSNSLNSWLILQLPEVCLITFSPVSLFSFPPHLSAFCRPPWSPPLFLHLLRVIWSDFNLTLEIDVFLIKQIGARAAPDCLYVRPAVTSYHPMTLANFGKWFSLDCNNPMGEIQYPTISPRIYIYMISSSFKSLLTYSIFTQDHDLSLFCLNHCFQCLTQV